MLSQYKSLQHCLFPFFPYMKWLSSTFKVQRNVSGFCVYSTKAVYLVNKNEVHCLPKTNSEWKLQKLGILSISVTNLHFTKSIMIFKNHQCFSFWNHHFTRNEVTQFETFGQFFTRVFSQWESYFGKEIQTRFTFFNLYSNHQWRFIQ